MNSIFQNLLRTYISYFSIGLLLLFFVLSSCDIKGKNKIEKDNNPQVEKSGKTVATVNGYAITEWDLGLKSDSKSKTVKLSPANKKTLEKIIDEVLLYQKGVELGLDKDPRYQNDIEKKVAELEAFKRRSMRNYVYNNRISQIKVTDENARAFFEANKEKIQSEYHLAKLGFPSVKQATEALEELKKGVPFDELANRLTGNKKNKGLPVWDIGFLKWNNLRQKNFEAIADLKVGDISQPVIRSGYTTVYLYKLLEKRPNPDISFESMKVVIKGRLKMTQMQQVYESFPKTIRENAKIVYNL